ncbi:hypothetical protein C8J57DRAFT_1232848 [Mycena rebaudengoi]|nr:hypothetical protein C8J57DRAFT_1232848 [Mycena rebaudengoi]
MRELPVESQNVGENGCVSLGRAIPLFRNGWAGGVSKNRKREGRCVCEEHGKERGNGLGVEGERGQSRLECGISRSTSSPEEEVEGMERRVSDTSSSGVVSSSVSTRRATCISYREDATTS